MSGPNLPQQLRECDLPKVTGQCGHSLCRRGLWICPGPELGKEGGFRWFSNHKRGTLVSNSALQPEVHLVKRGASYLDSGPPVHGGYLHLPQSHHFSLSSSVPASILTSSFPLCLGQPSTGVCQRRQMVMSECSGISLCIKLLSFDCACSPRPLTPSNPSLTSRHMLNA